MKVLLVDTSKRSAYSSYVPLALLKLSTKHKLMGDHVDFVKAGDAPKKDYNKVYISTIFQFNAKKDVGYIRAYAKKYPRATVEVGGVAVTLMADYYKKHTPFSNVVITPGLVPELDKYEPDYNIAGLDYSYGFTSRGCPNGCAWCVVPKVEGKQYVVEEWKSAINLEHKIFRGMDNNILACSPDHVQEVFKYMSDNEIRVDFNQAMDCQLLMRSKELQELFIEYKHIWQDIRFAWDSKRCDKHAIATMDFLTKNKIRPRGDIIWYMLYDYSDSPDVVFGRVKQVLLHGSKKHKIKLMRYKDLATGGLLRQWGSIGDAWASWTSSTIIGILSGSGWFDRWVVDCGYAEFNRRIAKIATTNSKQLSAFKSSLKKEVVK